jgi:hypothetical protein
MKTVFVLKADLDDYDIPFEECGIFSSREKAFCAIPVVRVGLESCKLSPLDEVGRFIIEQVLVDEVDGAPVTIEWFTWRGESLGSPVRDIRLG